MSCNPRRRNAFTLIETVISLSIMSVLFLGLSGAVMIGSKAIPTDTQTGRADQVVVDTLNNLRSDFRQATAIKIKSNVTETMLILTIKDSGAAGVPSVVEYKYTAALKNFTRNSDGTGGVEQFANINGFSVYTTQDGADATVVRIVLSVKGTIQQVFETHIVLPDKPEVL